MHEQEGPDSLATDRRRQVVLAGPAGAVSTIQTESCCEQCGYILRGAALSCLLYHWRRFWHVALMIVLPPAMLALWVGEVFLEPEYYLPRLQAGLACALITAAAMMVGGAIGVLIGRPIGRGLLRVLLPNRPRQLFAFLWRRDGKEMPVGPF